MSIKEFLFQSIRAWIPEEPMFPKRLKKSSWRSWLFWTFNFGVIIGILGSIALNQEAIIMGFVFSLGSLFLDTNLQRKEEKD
jgi:hypothetical protein